ncbi:3-beta hydroxysteroid dehydrogenase/isomerase [Xylaria sp. CBS 124048]|nr:3-beta hydroxysteroid dehydrogenase/isomerase [Xylaria sp. CBS 124048]
MDGLVAVLIENARWAGAALFFLGVVYLWRLNWQLSQTPPEAARASPFRWADHEIRETYKRLQAKPIDWSKHLPPKANRRYVVTGGSGGVGGQIVLHLLARGESPESIRILDFKKVERGDMKAGAAARVDFVQADITSPSGTQAAFEKPWPASVAKLPLTVFHTAAMIVASERLMGTYERVRRVNVDGTQNVMKAAKAAGATIFIATSSASVAHQPADLWSGPFRSWPKNFFQLIDESDFDKPLRPHARFIGNYSHTKAVAERDVCSANRPDFRTGAIRPSNAIYGNSHADFVVGQILRDQGTQSWIGNVVSNFVNGGHISLAHLDFEAALLRKDMPACAGRPLVITDDGPPPAYSDVYRLCELTAATPVKLTLLPPLPFFFLAYLVESVGVGSRTPVLKRFLSAPSGRLSILQPAVFHACLNFVSTDALARRSVEHGGIGFRHVHTTLEGMCQQVLDWNIDHASKKA